MPRPARIHQPGSLFFVTVRGNKRQAVIVDHKDCLAFLQMIQALKARVPFALYAFCLMPDHFHLLLEVKKAPLSVIMQRLLTRYTKFFNNKQNQSGHLFEGRYEAVLCQKSRHLAELAPYIHANPCRSKIAKHPDGWPWTSHYDYMGRRRWDLVDVKEALAAFDPNSKRALQLYEKTLVQVIDMGYRGEFHPSASRPFLGDEAFTARCRERQERPREKRPAARSSLEALLSAAAADAAVSPELLRSASQARRLTSARGGFMVKALESGHKPSEIAAFLNRSPSTVSKMVERCLARAR